MHSPDFIYGYTYRSLRDSLGSIINAAPPYARPRALKTSGSPPRPYSAPVCAKAAMVKQHSRCAEGLPVEATGWDVSKFSRGGASPCKLYSIRAWLSTLSGKDSKKLQKHKLMSNVQHPC
jgi:hypothetical protein